MFGLRFFADGLGFLQRRMFLKLKCGPHSHKISAQKNNFALRQE